MTEYNAGEARLRIVPDVSQFRSRLEADMRKINAEFDIPIIADLDRAARDIERFRQEQQRNGIDIPVDIDTSRARAQVAGLRTDFDGLLSALKWNAGAVGVGLLPALSTALVDVAAGLQQVTQASLAIPGVIGGGVASIGTFKLGLDGMSDAFKALEKSSDGSSKNVEAANKALAELSPNAASVVKTLSDLTPLFKDVRNEVSQNLFAGIGEQIKTVVDADLPTLRKGLGGIATAWNSDLKQLGVSLSDSKSQGLLDRILGNTSEAQTRFAKAIDPLVKGIGTLVAGSSGALPRLADDFGKMFDRFDKFIEAADTDGRLAKWIDGGITGVEKLGETVLNVGKAFTGITQAAGGGDGFLTLIEKGSDAFQKWVNSTEGQNKLKEWFAEGRAQLQELLPIVQNLGPILGGLFDAAHDSAQTWLPILRDITGALAAQPGLVTAVADAFLAWKTIKGVSDLASSLANISSVLRSDLPAAAGTGASGIGAALSRVAVPAWLMYLVYHEGKALWDEGTKGDSPFPGVPTPTDPTGEKGLRDREANTSIMGVPSVVNDPIFAPQPSENPANPYFQGGNGPHKVQDPTGGLLLPGGGYQAGGPTPSGRGNGPTGGFITEVHGDEWVLPAHARAAVGDQALWALTAGRSFEGGGFIDQYGNPVTPGGTPGPATVAPNPTGGDGGIGSIVSSLVSGVSGPIANALSLGQGLLNSGGQDSAIPGLQTQHGYGTQAQAPDSQPSLFDRAAKLPGLFGLFGSLGSADPAANLMGWGKQTAEWLGNFTAKTVGGFTTALWQGGLDFFGLGNSILSPNNPWNQAGQSVGQFAFSSSGPLGQLLGANDGAGSDSSSTKSGKGPTQKQIREANDRISDRDAAVARAQQRLADLSADAKPSTRQSAQDAYDRAVREAAEARDDMTALMTGKPGSTATVLSSSSSSTPAGLSGTQATVYQAMVAAGFSASEWPALQNILNHESSFNPTARNPQSGAWGLFQFLGHENDKYGALGGYSSDPAQQSVAGLQYIKDRYGSPSNAWDFWQSNNWYSSGGPTPPGRSTVYPAFLHGDEYVISARGRATVPDSFLHALNTGQVDADSLPRYYDGGPTGLVIDPTKPNFDPGRGAITKSVPAAVPPPPKTVSPSPTAPPVPAASVAPTPDASASPEQQQPQLSWTPPSGVGAAPSSLDHNLPALSTGISSGFATAGSLAATAIAAAMASSGGGAAGSGLAGSLAQGLFMQGGKIANDAANVVSSFLVGNVTSGTNPNAYGQTLRAPQNVPITAQPAPRNYTFNGMDIPKVMQEMDLRDAQDNQALTGHRTV